MTIKDKLEIGLKPDAPYRKDNLPDSQQDDSTCQDAAEPGDDPSVHRARNDCDDPAAKKNGTSDTARRGPNPK
jgi:hypothetical protein